MRELMLELLTYEPFEKVVGTEKKYIDAILDSQSPSSLSDYQRYDDLFSGFYNYVQLGDWSSLSWFKNWKDTYYPNDNKTGANYPVLFKKICFYSMVNGNMSCEEFKERGIISHENIIKKWKISVRYRQAVEKSTYSPIRLFRNGRKQEYITKVIKSAYYEASRQVTSGGLSPKKQNLLEFVDVFAGTGVVSASVDAKNKVVNDADSGAACFLYAMSRSPRELKKRFASLHNNFVSTDMYPVGTYYTDAAYQKDLEGIKKHIKNPDKDFIIRVRNNYGGILNLLSSTDLSVKGVDFDYLTTLSIDDLDKIAHKIPKFKQEDFVSEEFVYDVGAAWLFVRSMHRSTQREPNVMHVDSNSYNAYIEKSLGIKHERLRGNGDVYAQYLSKLKLKYSDIDFCDKSYFKNIKGAKVSCEDFRDVIKKYNSEGEFLYLDSPYFLTVGYEKSFGDEDHKQMLDLIRTSNTKWLFSMKFKAGDTAVFDKNRGERKNSGDRLIENYLAYYKGFANDFVEDEEKNLYTQPNSPNSRANSLYVIFLYSDSTNSSNKDTEEIMICNFDVRRVIPYKKHDTVVMPYNDFIKYVSNMYINQDFWIVREQALKWREEQIKNNYASGELV